MTEVIKKISVDLSRRGNTRLVFARQNDQGSRRVVIKLTDGGVPYKVPAGTVATVNILRADGSAAAMIANVTEDGEVELTLGLYALSVSGEAKCSVSLYGTGGKRLTSADFILDIQGELYSGDEPAEDPEPSMLTEIMAELADFRAEEAERDESEEKREAAEESRDRSENLRKNSELGRNNAENQRINGENARSSAEIQRETAERAREEAEGCREFAENMRLTCEVTRSQAELAREEAEERRAAAEIAREQRMGEILGISGEIVLEELQWQGEKLTALRISELGDNDMISFYPKSLYDRRVMSEAELFIRPDASEGVVTFSAETPPTDDICLCYFITRGAAI